MELKKLLVIRYVLRHAVILSLFLTVSHIPLSSGFSGGAPASAGICNSMTPAHGAPVQTSPVPYEIKVNKNSVSGGDKVVVTLVSKSDDEPFKGFLVLGRKKDFKKDTSVFGTFSKELKAGPSDEDKAQLTNCGDKQGSSATHSDAEEKKKVELEWEAPNEDGEYVLLSTFVKDHETYWVEHPSDVITVKKNENLAVRSTPTPPPVVISDEVKQKLRAMYTNCGDAKADIPKGCFGIPEGCVSRNDCELFVTFRLDGDNGAKFELAGLAPSYVSVGISHDPTMGQDSVVGCRADGSTVSVGEYYNTKAKVNQAVIRKTGSPPVIRNASGRFVDGHIMCEFNMNRTIEIPETGEKFDLENDKLHLLLSRGVNSAKDYLGQHPTDADKAASPDAVYLSQALILEPKSPLLIQLHGALMIFAWLFLASTGMFTARYYKNTHTSSKPCGVAFWFSVHRMCMFLALILSISASVIIFVDSWAFTYNPNGPVAEQYHPILGVILTSLLILQVLIAFCRPGPNAKSRFLFNWFHWFVGNAVHIIAVACIFLANNLQKTNLQNRPEFWGILTGFVVFHIFLHIIMSIHTLKADRDMEIRNKKRAVLPGPMKAGGIEVEAPGTGFRSAILTVYALVAAGAASGLVYFVIISLQAPHKEVPTE